jgi:hypothetical protein
MNKKKAKVLVVGILFNHIQEIQLQVKLHFVKYTLIKVILLVTIIW